MFKNRSFNVKLVKDSDTGANPEDTQASIETAQAYAEMALVVAEDLTKMALVLIVAKGLIDVAKIGAKAFAR